MSNKWQFQKKPAGEFDGFRDAGIEYFTGNPYSSLAREVIQNSLDANDKNSPGPVRVYFDLVNVGRDDFPGRKDLKSVLESCLELAQCLDVKEAKSFFSKAISVIERQTIPCLRIADTGTVGLRGPCKLSSPYFAFVKAQGQSVKSSSTAGGSYGIGKNAPFALSNLRTIFVSTTYWRDGTREDLAQGKAILMSHRNGETDEYASATGYFGDEEGCLPITPAKSIPNWLRRDYQFHDDCEVQGTSVFITGFQPNRGWQYLLIASVISNYFEAIYSGRLEVIVDNGKHEVSRAKLMSWFLEEKVREAAKTEDVAEQLELAQTMSECFSDQTAITEDAQLRHLGHCRMHLLVREKLTKRVGVTRKGMLVTTRLKRLRRFAGFSDFVAVVYCLDPDGNELLRRMENPEHDNFEPERLREPAEVKKGRKALDMLADFVRRSLRKHAQVERGEVTELEELSEFFQDPDKEDTIPQGPGETDLSASVTVLAQPQKRASFVVPRNERGDSEGENGGGRSGHGGDSDGTRSRRGTGQGSKGTTSSSKLLPLSDIRTLVIDSSSRELFFTPGFTGVAKLIIQDMGADSLYDLKVKSVHGRGEIKDGTVTGLTMTKGERIRLRIELAEEFDGSIRVIAHAV